MDDAKKFYTIEEATGILGISETEIKNIIDNKGIPVLEVGRAIRISEENMEKLLDFGETGTTITEDNYIQEEITGDRQEQGNPELYPEWKVSERENEIKENITRLQMDYDELLKRKQELEEDINYLQSEFEDFRTKIKKLVVEELKSFLKKIDNEFIITDDESLKEQGPLS
ncbi:MAG: helix-turn-helix domain-containing protein [Actinobacteria bacterium]|nr:helix-turn-helix domain-containing protein [Actinomycetota bacterium]